MTAQDWSIQEIARLVGTTSRTLRHYDEIGLLPPARIAANGYRHYDEAALVRLQRILLLRELGLGLPAIAEARPTAIIEFIGMLTGPVVAAAQSNAMPTMKSFDTSDKMRSKTRSGTTK